MLSRTFPDEEKSMSAFKTAKVKLLLLLGSNEADDDKVKPVFTDMLSS